VDVNFNILSAEEGDKYVQKLANNLQQLTNSYQENYELRCIYAGAQILAEEIINIKDKGNTKEFLESH
tara:strand:- start:141 stop:344 length:204 start_codon:yes stop_codon:yes gene_type:complete